MSMHPLLSEATDPLGRPRFYEPFEHPATARLRAEIAKLEAWELSYGETKETREALDWLRRKLLSFEEGEWVAKAHYVQEAIR